MRDTWLIAALLLIASAASAGPSVETELAFSRYVELTEAQIAQRVSEHHPFLWIEGLSEADRTRARATLDAGSVVIERLETRDRGDAVKVPDGMVHHWVGAVLIPHVPVERAVRLFQDYQRYGEIYAPTVTRSRLLHREGPLYRVFLQFTLKKILTVVLNTEYAVAYRTLSGGRMHVASRSMRIAEVDNAGTPEEREKPEDEDRGFLWRINNYCSFAPSGADTYLECETVSLSRSIPLLLGPIVRPFVTSIPRDSLAFTLEATRDRLVDAPARQP